MNISTATCTATSRTAAGQYQARSDRIDALLARLQAGRTAHAAAAAAQPDHWGYPGDLGALEQVLAEALARVSPGA